MSELSYERSLVPAARPTDPVRRHRLAPIGVAAVLLLGVVVAWGATRPPNGLVAVGPTSAVVLSGATMPVSGDLETTTEGHDVFAATPSESPLRFQPADLQPQPRILEPDLEAIDTVIEGSVVGPVVVLPTTRGTQAVVFAAPAIETNTFIDDIASRIFDQTVLCVASKSSSICAPNVAEFPAVIPLEEDPATLLVAWIGLPAETAVVTVTDEAGGSRSHRPIGSSVIIATDWSDGAIDLQLDAFDPDGAPLSSQSFVASREAWERVEPASGP